MEEMSGTLLGTWKLGGRPETGIGSMGERLSIRDTEINVWHGNSHHPCLLLSQAPGPAGAVSLSAAGGHV